MKKYLLLSLVIISQYCFSQGNVGIGTTTPRGPLSFGPASGQKIILWDDGNADGNNYGIGIQSGLLQLHTYTAVDDIAFGYGKSDAFNERMRIINSGDVALDLRGRITMRNGTGPIDINYGPGIWLTKADNSGTLGFIGVQNNQNMGFYGGPGGWGLTYNALNSRVGIGNNNPNAPLSFAATLEKKITLYPGATGDVGFGVSGNRLQIYSDNPNADVAIGYDAAGTFNERFAVKANGALAVYGNTGSSGQILKSNGPGSAASWSGLENAFYQFNSTDQQLDITSNNTQANPAGLHNQTITVTRTSSVIVTCRLLAYNFDNAFGGNGTAILLVGLNNNNNDSIGSDGTFQKIGNGEIQNLYCQFLVDNVAPGVYTTSVTLEKGSGDDYGTGGYYTHVNGTSNGNIIVQVIPK